MADKLIGQFDPAAVQINLGVASIPTGAFADGTFINATRNTPERWRRKIGTGGGVTRVKVNDDSGTVELTVKQEHPINDVLRTLFSQDETFAFNLVKPGAREERVIGDQAWVESDPDISLGDDEENRTWVIGIAEMIKI